MHHMQNIPDNNANLRRDTLERHDWDIHALSTSRLGGADSYRW
jgi:hypothetical protein